jgi:NAD+ synthase (glutamine-hydrolysing)
MGFTKAILGSSGGIDSAVTQALGVAALGKENLRSYPHASHIPLPTRSLMREQLCRSLDNPFDILPIKDIYDSFMDELKPVFRDLPFSVAEKIYRVVSGATS